MDDKYVVEHVACHACAARDRKRHILAEAAREGNPTYGSFLVVHPE